VTALDWHSSRQAWRNGYIESFNSRVRDECLTINIFWSLRTPASSSEIGSINITTTDPAPPSTTSRRPATPPTAPTNNPPKQLER
jgi:Integrase core domain